MTTRTTITALGAALTLQAAFAAPGASVPQPPPGIAVVSGTVPDEATRQAILARVRALYGAEHVIDQLGVGDRVAPPNWGAGLQRMLQPELKQISRGQISVSGNLVDIRGEVSNEAVRQHLASQLSTRIDNPTYTIRNGLRVAGGDQRLVDATLANRIVEFEPGSALLTPGGRAVLDLLVPVLRGSAGRGVEIIGHTDAIGAYASNVALSLARADSVKSHLLARGLSDSGLTTSGVGPDRPLASNATAEGRARNRRIEFRVGP